MWLIFYLGFGKYDCVSSYLGLGMIVVQLTKVYVGRTVSSYLGQGKYDCASSCLGLGLIVVHLILVF